ncbi:hypothetical protein [Methanobacterium sp. MZD130B]|jgi:hypothetical protein|uniref:hypothetical protein n=1 Tax=Methanobacterium sp. MZD130B TaxID=3394378 RepID=UPI0039FCDE71
MCFQAIAEIMGTALGYFIIAIVAVSVLFVAGILIFDLFMFLAAILVMLIVNPLSWVVPIVLIILLIVGFFVLINRN